MKHCKEIALDLQGSTKKRIEEINKHLAEFGFEITPIADLERDPYDNDCEDHQDECGACVKGKFYPCS